MTHAEIVERLGGYRAVAAALGADATTTFRWPERGIPSHRWAEIVRLAGAMGVREVSFEALANTAPPKRPGRRRALAPDGAAA